MIVRFVLPRLSSSLVSKYADNYKIVRAGLTLKRYPAGYKKVSQEYIDLARSIVQNNDFLRFIKTYRIKYQIPSKGISYEEYLELSEKYKDKGIKNPYIKLYFDIYTQIRERQISVFPLLKNHLHTLVIGGFIVAPKTPFEIDYPTGMYEFECVEITINTRQKFSKLIGFLNKNKVKIAAALKRLPEGDYKLTKEDIKILRYSKRGKDKTQLFNESSTKKSINNIVKNTGLNNFYKKSSNAEKMTKDLFYFSSEL